MVRTMAVHSRTVDGNGVQYLPEPHAVGVAGLDEGTNATACGPVPSTLKLFPDIAIASAKPARPPGPAGFALSSPLESLLHPFGALASRSQPPHVARHFSDIRRAALPRSGQRP